MTFRLDPGSDGDRFLEGNSIMNVKRLLLAIVAVFVAQQAMELVIHMKILGDTYASIKGLWRPDMQDYMWMMHVIGFAFCALFVHFYVSWRRVGGVGEGMKYGLIVGLIVGVSGFMQYMIYPLPFSLVVKWLVFGTLQSMVMGAIASGIYRPAN